MKREVPGFRVGFLQALLVGICSLVFLFSVSPAYAQSGSGSDQPQVEAPEKPFDPSTVEPTSLHPATKDDVRKNTEGLKIKPGKMLHTDVDVALVNVTVTDPYNRLVTGLEPDNFRVFEDNIEQEVVTFSSEDVPISIGVVFDLSGSMSNKIAKAREAAMQFFKTANPAGRIFPGELQRARRTDQRVHQQRRRSAEPHDDDQPQRAAPRCSTPSISA